MVVQTRSKTCCSAGTPTRTLLVRMRARCKGAEAQSKSENHPYFVDPIMTYVRLRVKKIRANTKTDIETTIETKDKSKAITVIYTKTDTSTDATITI